MDNKQSIGPLNDLLEYLNDSYRGYQECTKDVNDNQMTDLFCSLSIKRQRMAQELAEKIKALGGTPQEGGSLTGAAHRVFVNLKSMLTGKNVDAIINEIKRGENTTIARYKEVLKEEALPLDIQTLLSAHLDEFEEDLANIDGLSITISS